MTDEPIDYDELEKLYNECFAAGHEPDSACTHPNVRITQDGNAITVHCPTCGLYGVMDVETARRLGWV